MSLSSLPDIFRKAGTPLLTSRKQGGQFSLHLNSQSVDKYAPSRAGFAPGDRAYATLTVTKRRSASTASVRPRQSFSRTEGHRKPDTARDKMLVSVKEEAEFWTTDHPRSKAGLGILNLSNFPYESNRKFNNMTIDLEESDSLKNKTEFDIKETQLLLDSLRLTQ